ncbi:entry exclusion lipoprotein TrbK [Sedimenticola hydrogenitrophicus]|uniref:entry exclusion lipoprotein TrbK n=1 Tax=Sedimenticola hydrogenitrophicus TaxID=2967975 RepID=UPI003B5861C3
MRTIIIFGLTVLLSGCFSEDPAENTPLPEANNANCKPEFIAAIEPKSAQEKFAGECARQGTFKQSPERTWGPSDLY